MTREEAKKSFYCLEAGTDGISLVDEIYDEFESRTCESCINYDDGRRKEVFFSFKPRCKESIGAGLGTIEDGWLPKDFCCNRYEPKDNK